MLCEFSLMQPTYDKLLTEVPKYKMITPSVLADRLRVRCFWYLKKKTSTI